MVPKVEWQLNNHLKLFVQPTVVLGLNGGQDINLNLQTSLAYGYKLIINEDLKLQLTSSIGYPNYFQVSIINSKFRAAIPFATSQGSPAQFQLIKVTTMLLTYIAFQGYWKWQRKNKQLREKILRQSQARFSEQRRELQRQISFVQMSAAAKKQKQIKYRGLVVMKAIMGEKSQLQKLRKKINKIDFPKRVLEFEQELAEMELKLNNLRLVRQNYEDQLCDVTILLQN